MNPLLTINSLFDLIVFNVSSFVRLAPDGFIGFVKQIGNSLLYPVGLLFREKGDDDGYGIRRSSGLASDIDIGKSIFYKRGLKDLSPFDSMGLFAFHNSPLIINEMLFWEMLS